MKTKLKIIYVYDALCGWCYGFSPVMLAVYEQYGEDFDFEVISGGMLRGDQAEPGRKIFNSCKIIEDETGILFGQAFLHNLEKEEMIFNSEMPAIALSVFKSIAPRKAVEFVHHLQNSIFFDGS